MGKGRVSFEHVFLFRGPYPQIIRGFFGDKGEYDRDYGNSMEETEYGDEADCSGEGDDYIHGDEEEWHHTEQSGQGGLDFIIWRGENGVTSIMGRPTEDRIWLIRCSTGMGMFLSIW